MKQSRLPPTGSAIALPSPDSKATPEPGTMESAPRSSWLLLAHILRPQGRKGEVLAELFTDFPERFEASPRVFLARPHFTGTPEQARSTQILDFFLPVGKNSGRIVLAIEGIGSITEAETLAGLDVLVPHEERLTPEEDASYVSDLVGCTVHTLPDTLVGTVDYVQFPTTPDGARRLDDAAPLLIVLSPTGDEILIPYVKAYLLSLDPEAKRIHMALPPGLLEINA